MDKVIIFTGGGDCGGLNAAIRGAVKTSYRYGIEIYGGMKGWEGLVYDNVIPLSPKQVIIYTPP